MSIGNTYESVESNQAKRYGTRVPLRKKQYSSQIMTDSSLSTRRDVINDSPSFLIDDVILHLAGDR